MRLIGLRTIKTAISVGICCLIFIILRAIEYSCGSEFKFSYVLYSPFFAGIATAYSLYPDKKRSLSQAKNRIIASLIGGLIGILLVVIYEAIGGDTSWPLIYNGNQRAYEYILPFFLVATFTVLIIVTSNVLKQSQAAFVAILTFISVTLNPNATISSVYGEWLFGLNRILSTIIGVLVALFVNLFHIPFRKKNDDLLFCIGIEGLLKTDYESIKGFMNYKMNHMDYIGANCTLYTTRTPTTFMPLLSNVSISAPVICCSGAALYDTKNLKFIKTVPFEKEDVKALDDYFKSTNVSAFKNYVIDDVLHIYNGKIDNMAEKLYIKSKKNAQYTNVDILDVSNNDNVLYYLLIEEKNVVEKLLENIKKEKIYDKLTIQIYDYFDTDSKLVPDYKYVKIYSKEVEKLEVLKDYAKENNLRTVGLTTCEIANSLLKNVDYSVTFATNVEAKDYATILVNSISYDKLFKTMNKMFYSKKYAKKENLK